MNPAKHNILDFLNPRSQTYAPELSSARVPPPAKTWKLGKWEIPLSRPILELRRKSKPFWEMLGNHGIGIQFFGYPLHFLPSPFQEGCFSDVNSRFARYSRQFLLVFNRRDRIDCRGWFETCAQSRGSAWEGSLRGPETTEVKFDLLAGSHETCKLSISGSTYSLTKGEYSPWIRLNFLLASLFRPWDCAFPINSD